MLEPTAFSPFPKARHGDVEKDTIYASIGRVTTSWERCDHALAHVYASFLGYPQVVGIMRAYGALATFALREKLIRAAAESHFYYHPDLAFENEAGRVLNLAVNASARRTEIAHGVIFSSSDRAGHFLGPPIYSTKKRDFEYVPSYSLNSEQMTELVAKLNVLYREITSLADRAIDQIRE